MSLIKYRALLAVVRHSNITKAAEELGYTQPGISRMIRSLEDEFGIPLTKNDGFSIAPTDDCKALLPHIEKIIQHEDELLETITARKNLADGTIRIGAMNSMLTSCLAKVIYSFSKTYPHIDLNMNEMSLSDILNGLENDMIDIGFTSEFQKKGLQFIPAFNDPILLLVNRESSFALQEKISLSSLNGCDLIMFTPDTEDILHTLKKTTDLKPVSKYYVSSDSAGIAMVSKDLGAYIISELEIYNKLLPDNVIVKNFEKNIFRTMGIGMKSYDRCSQTLKEFVKTAKNILAAFADENLN